MLRFLRGGGKRTKTIWWLLIVITVITFLGGFVFLFGSGMGNGRTVNTSGAVATVNGHPISRTDYQNALNGQRQAYAARYGNEPGEQEMQTIEAQSFRSLVLNKLLDSKAKSLGLEGHDRDVLLQLQTNPPQALLAAPAFQTNGQFDPQKYAAAMRDPNNNWAPFEQEIRDQMPVRKLQEHLFTSVKISEGELKDEWRNRNEKVTATVVSIQPDRSAPPPRISDADLDKVYERYKSRFVSGPQRRVEVLLVPKAYGDASTKAAADLANGLVKRIRAGENFDNLSREYSDAPGAERGGAIERQFSPSDFGPQLGPQMALLDTGQVTDAIRDGGRYMFFKILTKTPQAGGQPQITVAQFMVRIKGDEDELRKQYAQLTKLRGKAQRDGLGRAATTMALSTTKTAFFDPSGTPAELAQVPSAVDWAFGAGMNDVSPVLESLDYFALAQVIASKPAGPMPKDAITDQLRQLAQLEASIDALKPRVDAMTAALKAGQTLEQAAAAAGVTAEKMENVTRSSVTSDPRLFSQYEIVGQLFAARPGQVVGPLRGLGGYVAARLESKTEPDWNAFNAAKGQFAQQLLEGRQRAFIDRYTNMLRAEAKVKDLRSENTY